MPFRIHATYDETISRFLNVIERVHGRTPLRTRFIIDHAETVSLANIERIRALGGGIAIQHRMAFQGEAFAARYGERAASATPPVHSMLECGVPVGAGTDATRVASYDPWTALWWLTTGRTVGGTPLNPDPLDRETALRLWTTGSAWFSGEADRKGRLAVGCHADLAVLSADYFRVPDAAIREIASELTVMNGEVVFASGVFAAHDRPPPPAGQNWIPARHFGTPAGRSPRYRPLTRMRACHDGCAAGCSLHGHQHQIAWTTPLPVDVRKAFWGALGCQCFAA